MQSPQGAIYHHGSHELTSERRKTIKASKGLPKKEKIMFRHLLHLKNRVGENKGKHPTYTWAFKLLRANPLFIAPLLLSLSAMPLQAQSQNSISIRMSGVVGDESASLLINGNTIRTWTLSSQMADYTVSTNASGELRVSFTNDSGNRDVRIDYVNINGTILQAEDQDDNTGVWGNGACGGGSFSEQLHCNGSIGFGVISSPSTSTSSTSTNSSSTSSGSSQVCDEMCQWYQDAPRPLCKNQTSGWGWENQQSCIGLNTCNSQQGGNGVVLECTHSTNSSSSTGSSSTNSSGTSSSSTTSSSTTSSSTTSSSSSNSSSTSSSSNGGAPVPNMLSNGDVEDGLSPWEGRGTTIELSQAASRSGSYSVLAANRTANWNGIAMPLGDLANNSQYAVSVWVKLAAGEPNSDIILTVQRVDANGTQYDNLTSVNANSSEWIQLQGTYSHTAVGTVDTLIAYVESSSDDVQYHVDDMVLLNSGASPIDPDPTPTPNPTPNPTTGVENSGAHCNIPNLASYSQLDSQTGLPDPFKSMSGNHITSKSEWTCRRAEISAQAQHYELGEKPSPATVTASSNGSSITVNVQENGNNISFNASITLPNTGQPPYPAIIGMGGSSLNNTALANRGVAIINFPNNDIAEQTNGGSRGNGKFYQLYGSNHSAGAMTAWAWGVSRLIDALEQTPNANIDASRLGVTGCSRNGKGALIAGALDERILLTIPQESGSGGAAAWRVSDAQKNAGQNVQTLSQIVTENVWFRESFSQFSNTASRLPFDHHEVMGLVAPRALLVIENTDQEWLGNVSTYTAAIASREIWKALNITDHMGVSQVGGHSHCQFPSSQQSYVDAFVDRFLTGSNPNANTSITSSDGNFTVDSNRWINWDTPSLQ